MVGKKRTRKTTGAAAGSSRRAAASTKDSNTWDLLQHLRRLSGDAQRCAALWEALVDGRFDEQHAEDAYWLLLGTHMIQKLLPQREHVVVLSHVCFAMSQILAKAEKSQLEKACASSVVIRSLLGRAILSVTVGSTFALESRDDESSILAALLALDTVIHIGGSSSAARTDDTWTKRAQPSLEAAVWNQENEAFCHACESISWSVLEEKCLMLLVTAKDPKPVVVASAAVPISADEPVPKRSSRRTTTKRKEAEEGQSPLAKVFDELIASDKSLSIRIDGRVAFRRWAATAFVWLCRGQQRVLEVAHALLNENSWELQCPAPPSEESTTEKPAASDVASTRQDKKEKTSSPRLPPLTLPADVVLVTVVCRMMEIVSERGNNCGARPPTGCVVTYVKAILPPESSSPTRRRVKSAKTAKPDVRHLATVVAYYLIQTHLRSVETNQTLINDEEDGGVGPGVTTALFYPFVHRALDGLSKAAASSVGHSSYSDQSQSLKQFSNVAASFVLQHRPIDAKLSNFAMTQLCEVLRNADAANSNRPAISASLEELYQLSQPLPVPELPKPTRKRKASDDASSDGQFCSFAGVLTTSNNKDYHKDEAMLALFLRAMRSASEDDPAKTLLSRLIQIVQCCYTTAAAEVSSDSPEGRPAKRRKAAAAQGSLKETKAAKESVAGGVKRISPIRASLASEATNALQLSVEMYTPETKHLCQTLRKALTTEQICQIIQLGQSLDDTIIKTRTRPSDIPSGEEKTDIATQPEDESEEPAPPAETNSLFGSGRLADFSHYEKTLWTSHINMCFVIGRGVMCQDKIPMPAQPILGDAEQRLQIVRAVAASKVTSVPGQWPLWLPAPHHAVLTSNFVTEPLNRENVGAERFICDGLVNSIGHYLQNPAELPLPVRSSNNILVLDDEIPLSLRDARLALIALGRLPKDDQVACLKSIVDQMVAFLSVVKGEKERLAEFGNHGEFASFIGRVVTFCASVASLIAAGSGLQEDFFVEMKDMTYHLPNFRTAIEWNRCEKCYVGVFHPWESSVFPNINLEASAVKGLSDDLCKSFESLLELTFYLGLRSAQNDKCHLLFASWNAFGLMPLLRIRRENSPPLPSLPSFVDKDDGLSLLILQVREDICMMYQRLGLPSDDSTLARIIREQDTGGFVPFSQINASLKSMITRAGSLINSLLGKFVPEDEGMQQDVPATIFPLLEALAAYLSFAIAMYSKPSFDYISAQISSKSQGAQKRKRGYSSDSERQASEGDSVETDGGALDDEAHATTFGRLRDACEASGAAPTYPDWLDVNCVLRDGISSQDAIESSAVALKGLLKLVSVAHQQQHKHLHEASTYFAEEGKDKDHRVALALRLCGLLRVQTNLATGLASIPFHSNSKWNEDIGKLSKIAVPFVDILLHGCNVQNKDEVKEAWCPTSASRIVGRLRDRGAFIDGWVASRAELRSGGEWEVLLSDALASACIDVELLGDTGGSGLADENIREGRIAVQTSERWRSVVDAALSSMVPAAALLRYALAKGGREPHPLAWREGADTEREAIVLDFSEPLPAEASLDLTNSSTAHETLSTVVRLCAGGHADIHRRSTCKAIAAHLLVDSRWFEEMEGMEALRQALVGLSCVREVVAIRNDLDEVVPVLCDQICTVLAGCGRSSWLSPNNTESRLLGVLGGRGLPRFDTVSGKSVEATVILESIGGIYVLDASFVPYQWVWGSTQDRAIADMIAALCGVGLRAHKKTRSRIAYIIGQLAELDNWTGDGRDGKNSNSLAAPVIKAFNAIDEGDIQRVVLEDVCAMLESEELLCKNLCLLLSCLLACNSEAGTFAGAKLVFTTLLDQFNSWSKERSKLRLHVLDLFFLYGCCFGGLREIASKLNPSASKCGQLTTEFVDMENIERFFSFVRDVRLGLSGQSERFWSASKSGEGVETGKKKSETALAPPVPKTAAPPRQDIPSLPRSCSFAVKSGFHGQHWYNCYTCGLVWDKGCCTLCALVCHQGHDVSYSRYSSFFCDCGAEDGSTEGNRVSCKCLSLLSQDKVETLASRQRRTGILGVDDESSNEPQTDRMPKGEGVLARRVPLAYFRAAATDSINEMISDTRDSTWMDVLFQLLRHHFSAWQESKSERPPSVAMIDGNRGRYVEAVCGGITNEALCNIVRHRSGAALALEHHAEKGLIPFRAARANTFQLKLSSDSTVDRVKRALLSKNDICRGAVVADSRGRLIICEPCSLVFCSALPIVNCPIQDSLPETLLRAQMCVLGSAKVGFSVVGLELCKDNERHLLLRGTSEAAVAIVNESFDGLEKVISLDLDFDPQDSGGDSVVVQCQWMPGSQTVAVVGSSHCVRVFDISRSGQGDRTLPLIGYGLGFEACLRAVAIVPSKHREYEPSSEAGKQGCKDKQSKLYILLDNGRIHSVNLNYDDQGTLEAPGHFDTSDCISLPITGLRSYQGMSTSRSLGEGSNLTFLAQAQLLLYQCVSSSVLALVLGANGEVDGSFELLPNWISPEALGKGPDGYGISGPYTHWTELGVVMKGSSISFRAACVGKSSRTNQPKLVYLEVSESKVRIREILWASVAPMDLGLSLSASFEGIAAFSAPILVNGEGKAEVTFVEQAFLCVAASNGSLLFYTEDTTSDSDCRKDDNIDFQLCGALTGIHRSAKNTNKPSLPLTVFESLTDVSDSDDLVFGGDAVGQSDADDIKTRLSRDSSLSMMSPRREGCTLTLSMRRSNQGGSARNSTHARQQNQIIAAVRILVGSTAPDCIPRKILIEGRPVELTPGMKKWYSLPLTDQEIALSVRNGFVAIGICSAFYESNNPMIDAVEVYACGRDALDSKLPKTLRREPNADKLEQGKGSHGPHLARNDHGLILSCKALTYLSELLEVGKEISDVERNFLKQLVQETALDQDKAVVVCISELLKCLQPNARLRESFHDECVVFGCSKAVTTVQHMFDKNGEKGENAHMLLRDALQTAVKIAKNRPVNYMTAVINSANSLSAGSIAVDSGRVLGDGSGDSLQPLDPVISSLTELGLVEMAVAANTREAQGQHFATFEVLRRLLESRNTVVVEKCCAKIASFFRTQGGACSASESGIFALLQGVRIESSARFAYQCDSCSLFPMTEIRYTLLEDDHDIDLCRDCYSLGREFAESKGFDGKISIEIKGKTIGGNAKLTCAQIKQMQPVSIQTADVDEINSACAHVKGKPRQGSQFDDPVQMEDDDELQKALRLSLGQTVDEKKSNPEVPKGHEAFEQFLGIFFSNVVELLPHVFRRETVTPHLRPIIQLLLDLVRQSKQHQTKVGRAKRLAKGLAGGISHFFKLGLSEGQSQGDRRQGLIVCLRGLSGLVVPLAEVQDYLVESTNECEDNQDETKPSKSRDRPRPRFVCEVHGVPAVRRRCARGVHKDRRFYVCGMERGSRCKYFVWADQLEQNHDEAKPKSTYDKEIEGFLWKLFSLPSTGDAAPLHVKLCSLLESDIAAGEKEVAQLLGGPSADGKSKHIPLSSLYGISTFQKDFADGVLCSREKLGDVVSGHKFRKIADSGSSDKTVSFPSSCGKRNELIEASFDLLSLIADQNAVGKSRWFSVLCEIISSKNEPALLRSLAKRVLKQLCGGKQNVYHSIRDHFVFGFQFRNLLKHAQSVLGAALTVKEKARVCGPNWKKLEKVNWAILTAGGLIGTQQLVSEDAVSPHRDTVIRKILEELWVVVKSRGENWRRFCGLRSLPHSYRDRGKSTQDDERMADADRDLFTAPPIVSLFWMSCCVSGANQVKVLKLVDYALTNWKERKSGQSKAQDNSSDEEMCLDSDETKGVSGAAANEPEAIPEDILLAGDKKLSMDDINGFIIQFVYGGSTHELRMAACHVSVKLCQKLSSSELAELFSRLLGLPLFDLGRLGKNCAEFLSLLQRVSSLTFSGSASAMALKTSGLIMSIFMQQIQAVREDRAFGERLVLENAAGAGTLKRRFDLSSCAHCNRVHPGDVKDSSALKAQARRSSHDIRDSGRTNRSEVREGAPSAVANQSATSSTCIEASAGSSSRLQSKKGWLPEQVCPFVRGRLDSGKEASTNNEFCTFFHLKYRLAISDIHVTVNDPRGRYVKTVTVYFTPRPVNDVAVLKSEAYEEKWQPCATLNLTRGASRASVSLTVPVVAANLKIEYSDFFERPGGTKSADGTLLIHCPRCTRVVTNAHGVCGNCGEVAFQCRKCRHINYDRLDAFLCVECGYCASGSFVFELTAGVASNAVAITNDQDHLRLVEVLRAASRLQEDLQNALRDKMRMLRKKTKNKDEDSIVSPALRRALAGRPPQPTGNQDKGSASIVRLGKRGSVVKAVARPGGNASSCTSSRASLSADRTRSLIQIARQMRSDSSSERRRSGDVIIRHLGRGVSIDSLDDESDLIGLIESSGGSSSVLDSSDPLSRLVASIQSSRRERGNNDDGGGGSGRGGGSGGEPPSSSRNSDNREEKKMESNKENLEDCERLHMLMREAERECFELSKRIQSWQRLEQDALMEIGTSSPQQLFFSPCHCSHCGSTVALQLLELWLRLFQVDPTRVKISREFVDVLLDDYPNLNKGSLDMKRLVVKLVATKSPEGSKLVLEELKKRLEAMRDVNSATLLGKIVDSGEFEAVEDYVQLAMNVLGGANDMTG